jgi:hypothetical protein
MISVVRCGSLTCFTKEQTPEVFRSGMTGAGWMAKAERPLVNQAALPMPTGLARPKHCGRFLLASRFCDGAMGLLAECKHRYSSPPVHDSTSWGSTTKPIPDPQGGLAVGCFVVVNAQADARYGANLEGGSSKV